MAMKLNAGEVGRSDLYSFLPEHIVVDQKENARVVPHSDEEVEALANSIKEYGQQQPAVVRRIDGNKVQLVAGYGRWRAVTKLNQENPEKPLKLMCRVADLNAEEAFVRSIVENNERAATTPTDDAFAQRRLREDFGWSEEKIATFYKKSVSYVAQLRKLLQLSTPIQTEVSKGNLTVAAALDVAQLPETEREAVVSAAKDPETGKVDANTVRTKVREKKQQSGGAVSRTMREVRAYFEGQTGPAESESVRKLCDKILDYISGKISDQQMTNALNKYTKAELVTA